jgi:hypothetical protein
MDMTPRFTSEDFARLAKVLLDVSGGVPSPLPPWHSVDGCKGNFQHRFKDFGLFDVTVHTAEAPLIARNVRTDE